MDIKDFKIGQTVWVYLINNASRNKSGDGLNEEWVIKKIGKRYVYAIEKNRDTDNDKFWKAFIWNEGYNGLVNKSDYSSDYMLFPTKQGIIDYMERKNLINGFRGFNFGNLSLDQLRRIDEIVNEEE